ncbi:MAG: ABC transporter substrate-binding protein [Deltaproteobacteria bacterium]|nr:ABC transporter substrate-binding protein [Deltaproteobacteria bacterium]
MSKAAFFVAIGIAWSLACAGPGLAPQPVPDEQRAAYDAALRKRFTDPVASRSGLEAFIVRYPASPMADDAALRLAEQAFSDGRQDEGRRWLGSILTQYPGSDGEPIARLRLAQLEYARDRKVAARGLLDPVDLRRLPADDAREALELKVSLSQTPVERMRYLARLAAVLRDAESRPQRGTMTTSVDTQRRDVERRIGELVAAAAVPELETMLDELDRRSPAPAIALELARRAVESGDAEEAEEKLERAGRLAQNDEQRERVDLLERRLEERPAGVARTDIHAPAGLAPLRELSEYTRPDTRGARGTIGVVLPLSGDFAEFGEASLRGILLAAGVFRPAAGGVEGGSEEDAVLRTSASDADRLDLRVVVRDSGSDPARAAEAVRELAAMEDVVAILGPIFSDEALAAAEAAEAAGVPLVTLSNREDVTQGRRFVMRTRTTPADEIGVLVDYAVDRLSARRFGVLYPRTRYGRGMRKLYADAVAARGSKLVTLASYSPEETDFSNVIKEMVGFRFLTAGERQAIAARDKAVEAARSLPPAQAARARSEAFAKPGPNGDPLPPIVDFDVLFIPDSADAIAMIAPGLALQGVRDVRLLGSSDWLDENLLRGADRHIAGAVVSAPFFVGSDVGVVREFVEAYRSTFAVEPEAYAAQGFDATNLVLQQLAAKRRDRVAVRDGMLAVRAFPGASGSMTMLPDGNARRRPFLLEVSGQRFVPLD